jgi:hypothetical protein
VLISDENINDLLQLYPEEKRNLLKSQLNIVNDLIMENQKKYKLYKGYSDAIDTILQLIMKGEFIKEE